MPEVRIPLANTIESRDSTLNKDALTQNAFVDMTSDGAGHVVKRPALVNKTSALGLGIAGGLGWGRGLFYYEGKVFSWNGPDTGVTWAGFGQSSDKLVLIAASLANPAFGQSFYINQDDEFKLGKKFGSFDSDGFFTSVLFNGTKFFAINCNVSNKFIAESTDGITWTILTTFAAGGTFSLASVKGTTLLFVDETLSTVIRSVDNGVTWTSAATGLTVANGLAIAVLGTRFSVGSAHSTDGITWTPSSGAAESMGVIASNGSYLIGFSNSTNVYKFSNNGTTWSNPARLGTGASSMDKQMKLVWSAPLNKWVGVCKNGKSVTSVDGTNWELGNRNESQYLTPQSLVYFDGAFYCYSYLPPSLIGNPYQLSFIEKSVDGVNWTTTEVDLAFTSEIPTIITGII